MRRDRTRVSLAGVVASACVAFWLAGCAVAPSSYDPTAHDYLRRHPLVVKDATARLDLGFGGEDARLLAAERAQLDSFLDSYIRAGHGPIDVVAYDDRGGSSMAGARLAAIEAAARQRGISRSELELRSAAEAPTAAVAVALSFRGHLVEVPSCRDFSRDNLSNFDNAVMSNFGCATQANLGRMIADPADLRQQREETDADTASASRVMGRHRAGQPTNSADNTAGPTQALGATQ
jgi:pilus assembly protein CpaD